MICASCGREFKETARSRTCGEPECVLWWREVGRYQDPDTYERHKLAKARSILKQPEKYTHERVAQAEIIVSIYGVNDG